MKTEALKAKEAQVTIAGVTIKGYQLPDGSYKASLSQVLEAFGISRGSATQEIRQRLVPDLATQALKVNRGKGKGSFQVNSVYLLEIELVNKVIRELAKKGNDQALDVLEALANETWQRRFDQAFGVQKTEATYEDQTREFFRQLAKETFHPLLTNKMNGSFPNNRWGTEVNNVKKAVGLPLVNVGDYNREQMMLWSDTITRYNCLREMDKSHRQALVELHRQRLERA